MALHCARVRSVAHATLRTIREVRDGLHSIC